ncbi:MAG: hypothetical protein RLZ57_768 [Actinomycetota bacterium]
MANKPTSEQIKRLPKVLLHDHLDGGLRPQTIIDIAKEIGYKDLPTYNAKELGDWVAENCNSGNLVRYLEAFTHTVAVMQRREDIVRVSRECALDLARDGVVYAEVRGAPERLLENGLSLDEVVKATVEGFRLGEADAKNEGFKIRVEYLICGMRHDVHSQASAELVPKFKGQGVVGFDIAGPEAGFPPTNQLETFQFLQKNKCHFTIHAGEAAGIDSIKAAVEICGAERIGHGVRIVEDIEMATGKIGSIAANIKEKKIALELCPSSNVQTGAAESLASHPIDKLEKLGFTVTINTDNRLMSGTSASKEVGIVVDNFGWDFKKLEKVTINAMNSAFIPESERSEIIEKIIKPGYAKISAE